MRNGHRTAIACVGKRCYTCNQQIIRFVQSFEPWDEVDACIFDKDIHWGVAITHEDKILGWGNINIV